MLIPALMPFHMPLCFYADIFAAAADAAAALYARCHLRLALLTL